MGCGPSSAPKEEGEIKPEATDTDRQQEQKQRAETGELSQEPLSIVILGASGDLAKKKTYPSLLDLYKHDFLPKEVSIIGYARSESTDEEFRKKLRPWLEKTEKDTDMIDRFLEQNIYHQGAYGSSEDFAKLNEKLNPGSNRLFYFAIPPNAFLESASSIKASALSKSGFNRLIVEKPFGHDFASAEKLSVDLGKLFTEDHIYRIDHYLAKELVQNLFMFRFGNTFLEPTFNNNHVQVVQITFKEPFGTEGRGGYFTNYGIIRDVIQNHLMQVLSMVAMDCPPRVAGPGSGNFIRDAKNQVLMSISPIKPEDVVLGQYIAADGKPGYLDDDSIAKELREKAKLVPTFAAVVMHVNTPRWFGVPFIVKAGKALNEPKVEVRVQFKSPPGNDFIFNSQHCARNELVMRLQPDESVYMKINIKEPGLSQKPLQGELNLSYKERYADLYSPGAYTRLILDAIRGAQGNFVRSDELLNSWKLFDPLLETLEKKEKRVPLPYKYGSRGVDAADDLAKRFGFRFEQGYVWRAPDLRN